jgi:hypothetical protein
MHAWFSAETALRQGSSVFRKRDASTVNVTRTDAQREGMGGLLQDERYVGEVVCAGDGGCVRANWRVPSIGNGG